MPAREIILPPGYPPLSVPENPQGREGHAAIINETGLPDAEIEAAAQTYFVEQASVGGIGRAPSTFQTYSANQGSMLARTEFQTPTNTIEEIKLARHLAERDDDVASAMQTLISLAYGEGMENFHEDERTVSIFNASAREMNLDVVLREMYREFLISGQINAANLFTRTTLEYTLAGSDTLRSDQIAWPHVGVFPAENIRVIDNDMFRTGTLAYVPGEGEEKLREWLDEYFNPTTTAARKHEMGMADRVAARMFTGVHEVDPSDWSWDRDALTYGRVYTLNPRLVFRHTMPKGAEKYPTPLLTRNFALLEAKRLLNIMDYALLQGGANFVVVAKKGDKDRPAQPAEIEGLKEVVRRASRTGVIVGDHRLTFDIITPELKELLNSEKRRLLGRKLARGLLRLPELDDESASEGVRLDAEIIARVVQNDRLEIKRFVERSSYREIVKRNAGRLGKGAAKLWFPKIVLQGTQYFNDLVLKLRDRGDIPRQWAVEAGGFDWDAAVQQREREVDAGTDETMAPASVPFSSPQAGPQDNQPGRPPGGRDDRPRQRIQQTPGETVRAMFDEEADRAFRMGDITFAILDDHPDYTVGRMTRTEREMLDAEEATRRGRSMYVPVNPHFECRSHQAIRLADGLSMILGERANDRALVAKMFVFREPEYADDYAAEEAVLRWGYPVEVPEEQGGAPTPNDRSEIAQLVEALAGAERPQINLVMGGGEARVLDFDEEGRVIGSHVPKPEEE